MCAWEDTRPDELTVKTRPSQWEATQGFEQGKCLKCVSFSKRGVMFIRPVSNTPGIGRVCESVSLFFLLVLAQDTAFPGVLCDFIIYLLLLLLL